MSTYRTLSYSSTFGLESRVLSEPSALEATIASADAIRFNSELGMSYYLESTETLDSDSCEVIDGPLSGMGTQMKIFAEATKAKEYYRIVSRSDN